MTALVFLLAGSDAFAVEASPGAPAACAGSPQRLTADRITVDGRPRLVARADKAAKPKNASFNDNVSGVPVFGWMM